MVPHLPFNRPYVTGTEEQRVREALASGWTGGNGPFSRRCQELLEQLTGSRRVLLTSSCTAALEMAALLAEVGPGDEVVLPSFTFVSSANAFVLRGATPVFADIDPDTLTLDPAAAADAVTSATRVIVAVHYAGGGCAMNALTAIARNADAMLVEDAAQAIGSSYNDRALGAIGDLGTLSFHETKNVSCGEGGALMVNGERWAERAEVLQEKGTNRARFARGEVEHYTWVDIGSSFLMSDVSAALLLDQLERREPIMRERLVLWRRYHQAFEHAERRGWLRRPRFEVGTVHNGHIYYVLAPDRRRRDALIARLAEQGIQAFFHYVPLHSSPAGQRFGRADGTLAHTSDVAGRLARLPLWVGMTAGDVDRVASAVETALSKPVGGPRA